jgi:hypothetical protein
MQGIFYEFVKATNFSLINQTVYHWEVELGVNYVIISLMPDFGAITLEIPSVYVIKTVSNYRFGRIKHYICFGEHVIGRKWNVL